MMPKLLAMTCCLALSLPAVAQQPAPPSIPEPHHLSPTLQLPVDVIVFDLRREALEPKRWGFEIHADGHGRYYAQGAPTVEAPSGTVWQDVTVSKATMERLLAGAQHDDRCETRAKHIANTGQKTLSFVHGDAWFTCSFNFSDNEAVTKTEETFQALAETIQFGVRLQHERRFDRLSLDPEMESLEGELKGGRALEIANIAPILKSLAQDERVIDRVRRRAARMLESAGLTQNPSQSQEALPR
ncbi:hypothetical protein SAMN05421819_0827 [Bryocella elongata]|uniref:Uncharacterized protein n=1 Tax=Bryocella elongata TaxID=863522 RepID=A0A1H5U3J1_9BACT|nr:hypothetical protein [Bryocella elongata]SEF68857.1 hypothetical protein SAMN05421819_0827 [Bryocella elongata]